MKQNGESGWNNIIEFVLTHVVHTFFEIIIRYKTINPFLRVINKRLVIFLLSLLITSSQKETVLVVPTIGCVNWKVGNIGILINRALNNFRSDVFYCTVFLFVIRKRSQEINFQSRVNCYLFRRSKNLLLRVRLDQESKNRFV